MIFHEQEILFFFVTFVVMKAFKNAPDASQERIRLRAIEAYRNRKGWASRPGIQLPPPVTSSPAF